MLTHTTHEHLADRNIYRIPKLSSITMSNINNYQLTVIITPDTRQLQLQQQLLLLLLPFYDYYKG